MPKFEQKKLGREHLERIIDLCKSVEERGLDPFLVDVESLIPIIQEYFPEWKSPEELSLDAVTVHQIASAIKLQSDWIKQRSTTLYTDPFLIEDKLQRLPIDELCKIFLKSWHPIMQLEQISIEILQEAMRYWQKLIPLVERWKDISVVDAESEITTPEELQKQQLMTEEFTTALEKFWWELKEKAGNQKIDYWDFIGAETYYETVKRAYMTSFLVTYGYAQLEIDRLEEMIYITPLKNPIRTLREKQARSVTIPVDFESWRDWRERS